MIICTAYTPDYAALAARLEFSCGVWEMPYHGVAFESRGSWEANNAFKPDAIIAVMDEHRCPVLWLDADCELIAKPVIPAGCDVGLCRSGSPESGIPIEATVFDFHAGHVMPNTAKLGTPWGGFMYFARTPKAEALLTIWQHYCEIYGTITSDEQCMLRALREVQDIHESPLNWRKWVRHTPAGTAHGKPSPTTWL